MSNKAKSRDAMGDAPEVTDTEAVRDRRLFIRCLEMLDSPNEGEVVNAARQAARIRQKYGFTWKWIVRPGEWT